MPIPCNLTKFQTSNVKEVREKEEQKHQMNLTIVVSRVLECLRGKAFDSN